MMFCRVIILVMLTLPSAAMANSYFGINGSYSYFTSPELKDYKVSPKGIGYGAMVGVGKDFVGLEAFYQNFKTEGDVNHEGEKAKINMNATALGAALRFSFKSFFLRLGAGHYSLDQSIDLKNSANIPAANDVYNIHKKGNGKMGMLFGIGVHEKFRIGRLYLDYTLHQIPKVGNYNALSLGMVWALPDSLF